MWIPEYWMELWKSSIVVLKSATLVGCSRTQKVLISWGFVFKCLHGNEGRWGEVYCWRTFLAAELYFWAIWLKVEQARAGWTSANPLNMHICGFIIFVSFSLKRKKIASFTFHTDLSQARQLHQCTGFTMQLTSSQKRKWFKHMYCLEDHSQTEWPGT